MKNKPLHWFLSLLFVASFLSCGDRPSNVLSEDKMVSLMVDMEIAEAYNNTVSRGNFDKNEMGKRILKAHGVSEESLDTTLAWYGRNLDEYAKLYEKVDKELLKKRKKYSQNKEDKTEVTENLWQFSEHLVMSPLSGSDSFTFSLPNPEVKNGEILELSFAIATPTGIKGMLGVEYSDGYGEGIVTNISSKNNINISLTTDTAKKISRIFGTISLKENKNLPIYIDSLRLITHPYDSVTYRSSRRSQKTFGPQRKEAPKKIEQRDSLPTKNDSTAFNKEVAISKDSLNKQNVVSEVQNKEDDVNKYNEPKQSKVKNGIAPKMVNTNKESDSKLTPVKK